MKKIVIFFIALATILSLCACATNNTNARKETNDKPSVNFDLTQYDAHGELSCGLIWVEKTTSSYDKTPETTFVYLDVDGNVKSEWFSSELVYKNDFLNDLLIMREKPYDRGNGSYVDSGACIIYDTNFRQLAKGYFEFGDGDKPNEKKLAILDPNARGEIFFIGELVGFGEGLFMITKDSIVDFPIAENALIYPTVKNLQKIRLENGYYVIDFRADLGTIGNLPCYMGVFDEHGNCIFEPSEQIDYEVFSVKVLSADKFEVEFKGKDGKMYTVTTDRTGTFLSEPE